MITAAPSITAKLALVTPGYLVVNSGGTCPRLFDREIFLLIQVVTTSNWILRHNFATGNIQTHKRSFAPERASQEKKNISAPAIDFTLFITHLSLRVTAR